MAMFGAILEAGPSAPLDLHVSAALPDILTTILWEALSQIHPGKLLPDSLPSETGEM